MLFWLSFSLFYVPLYQSSTKVFVGYEIYHRDFNPRVLVLIIPAMNPKCRVPPVVDFLPSLISSLTLIFRLNLFVLGARPEERVT
jgi:hypothetical protein